MRTFESVADLAAIQGQSIGQSDWVTISQEDVNLFADATGDHQWIHVDPERAAKGPFGKTIATRSWRPMPKLLSVSTVLCKLARNAA